MGKTGKKTKNSMLSNNSLPTTIKNSQTDRVEFTSEPNQSTPCSEAPIVTHQPVSEKKIIQKELNQGLAWTLDRYVSSRQESPSEYKYKDFSDLNHLLGLIKSGANINTKNRQGDTVLHYLSLDYLLSKMNLGHVEHSIKNYNTYFDERCEKIVEIIKEIINLPDIDIDFFIKNDGEQSIFSGLLTTPFPPDLIIEITQKVKNKNGQREQKPLTLSNSKLSFHNQHIKNQKEEDVTCDPQLQSR